MSADVGAAGPADVAAVAALEQATLGADAWSHALVEQGVLGRLPTVHYLVARDAEVVVGHVVVSVAGEVAELQRIAVAPQRRRTGVASRLLDAGIDVSGTATRMLLEVREDNRGARAFYAARRFVELDRRPRYYRDGAAALVLERRLTGPDRKVWTTS